MTTLDVRRDEKVKVLRAVRPVKQEEVVLGQYTAGAGMEGYLEDPVSSRHDVIPGVIPVADC